MSQKISEYKLSDVIFLSHRGPHNFICVFLRQQEIKQRIMLSFFTGEKSFNNKPKFTCQSLKISISQWPEELILLILKNYRSSSSPVQLYPQICLRPTMFKLFSSGNNKQVLRGFSIEGLRFSAFCLCDYERFEPNNHKTCACDFTLIKNNTD